MATYDDQVADLGAGNLLERMVGDVAPWVRRGRAHGSHRSAVALAREREEVRTAELTAIGIPRCYLSRMCDEGLPSIALLLPQPSEPSAATRAVAKAKVTYWLTPV